MASINSKYTMRWRSKHKEKYAAYQKRYRDAHKEKMKEYWKQYYALNKDRIKANRIRREREDAE